MEKMGNLLERYSGRVMLTAFVLTLLLFIPLVLMGVTNWPQRIRPGRSLT